MIFFFHFSRENSTILMKNRGAKANFDILRDFSHTVSQKIQIDEKLEVNLHCFYFSNDEE